MTLVPVNGSNDPKNDAPSLSRVASGRDYDPPRLVPPCLSIRDPAKLGLGRPGNEPRFSVCNFASAKVRCHRRYATAAFSSYSFSETTAWGT